MPAPKPKIFREIFHLRRMADAFPIDSCDTPPDTRHQLMLHGGALLTFTRNKDPEGESYYLSIKSPEKLPSAPVVSYLASIFFDPDSQVQELYNIRTPGVRCLRQQIPNRSIISTPQRKEISELGMIYYKLWMFNHLDISETTTAPFEAKQQERVDANARRESFVQHALKLLDFLLDKKHQEKDFAVSDFTNRDSLPIQSIPVYLEPELLASLNDSILFTGDEDLNGHPQHSLKIIRRRINEAFHVFFGELHPKYFPTREDLTREDFHALLEKSVEKDRHVIENFAQTQGTLPHIFPDLGQDMQFQVS